MRSLDINLASQPFRNNTLLWVGYGLGFTVLLAALTWNVTTWLEHRSYQRQAARSLEDIDSRMAALERRERIAQREQARAELDLATLTVQAVAANEVIERKAFSWTRLFNRMEETIPWNVHLTSVRPLFRAQRDRRALPASDDSNSIVVSVEGYAKDLNAFLDFESALIQHPSFDFPEPKRHQRNDRNEIVFEMDFTYYPAELEDLADGVEDAAEPDAEGARERAAAVGGDGPREAAVAGEQAPVEGEPDANGLLADEGPGSGSDDGAAAQVEAAGTLLPPGSEPPRIPPRPYATTPETDSKPAEQRRPPPRRRPDEKDKTEGGGAR